MTPSVAQSRLAQYHVSQQLTLLLLRQGLVTTFAGRGASRDKHRADGSTVDQRNRRMIMKLKAKKQAHLVVVVSH
jgi:hypothetical protein